MERLSLQDVEHNIGNNWKRPTIRLTPFLVVGRPKSATVASLTSSGMCLPDPMMFPTNRTSRWAKEHFLMDKVSTLFRISVRYKRKWDKCCSQSFEHTDISSTNENKNLVLVQEWAEYIYKMYYQMFANQMVNDTAHKFHNHMQRRIAIYPLSSILVASNHYSI